MIIVMFVDSALVLVVMLLFYKTRDCKGALHAQKDLKLKDKLLNIEGLPLKGFAVYSISRSTFDSLLT